MCCAGKTDGSLSAFNTDGAGFLDALSESSAGLAQARDAAC